MKLQKLTIENFKGIRSLVIEPNGHDINIYGNNAVGKTTIADAFFWDAFGKNSEGKADFDIKTVRLDGTVINNLNHSVEVVLGRPGETVSFKRTYKEVWTQKRGTTMKEFSGHTTDYFVNDVPGDQTDFNRRITAICRQESTFRQLTDPGYFASIKWQDRRSKLFETFAIDATDAAVIASSHTLKDLPAILGNHSVDEYRKIANAKKKAINDEIQGIPPVIVELNRQLQTDVMAGDEVDLTTIRKDLDAAMRKRASYEAGSGIAEITQSITVIEGEIGRYEIDKRREFEAANANATTARLVKQSELGQAKLQATECQRIAAATKIEHGRTESKLEDLRAKFRVMKAESYTGDETCPTCDQPIPADRIEEAKARFNQDLAQRKEKALEEGREVAATLLKIATRLEEETVAFVSATTEVDRITSELTEIETPATYTFDPFDEGYQSLLKRKVELEGQRVNAKESAAGKIAEINRRVQSLNTIITASEQAAGQRTQKVTIQARIDELTANEKTLIGQHEMYISHTALLDQFRRIKTSMVTDAINSKFTMAQFKLFEEQINGGISECCEITLGGRPWGVMSNAERINTGLDIINTFVIALSGINATTTNEARRVIECREMLENNNTFSAPPIFIDNAESVTNIIPTIGQQIRLIVSADDPELCIIRDGDTEAINARLARISRANEARRMVLESPVTESEDEDEYGLPNDSLYIEPLDTGPSLFDSQLAEV